MRRKYYCGRACGALILAAVLTVIFAFSCWSEEEATSEEVEAQIDIGVTSALADDAMKARQPVNAFKLLLDLIVKYPRNVNALHKYYDFLLNHRIKLSDEERAAALEHARTIWRDVENLEDVFLVVSGEQGIKDLFARVADDEALTQAFTELESTFRDNDFKSLAFYAYVATAHADKPIGNPARVAVGETLLRHGDYKAAETEFRGNCLGLYFPSGPALHQRIAFGMARARDGLGNTKDAVIGYKMAWQYVPDSPMGLASAERIARIKLDQGNRAEASSWCLQMKSPNPAHVFSDRRLNDVYSEEMASLGRYSDRLTSSLEAEITARPVPAEEEDVRKELLTHLANLRTESAEQREAARSQSLRSRILLASSAVTLDLFRDPGSIAARAVDFGRAAAVLRGGTKPEGSKLDQALLEANDAMIAFALREALVKDADDGTNGARLAAAYLYYAASRDGGGRSQLDHAVFSLSNDIAGLEKLYSSREVREKIASICRAAGLRANMKTEYGALIEQDIGAARSADALNRLAIQALDARRPGLAVAALKRIQEQFADQIEAAEVTYLLAEAYFQNAEWAKAKHTFAAYINREKKDEARRTDAKYLSGMCDFYAGNYPDAAANLLRFSREYPASERAQMAARVALTACARYGESGKVPADERRRVLLRLTERFAGTELAAEAHFYLGKLLTTNRYRHFRGALRHFEGALAGRQTDAAAYYLGLCYRNLGELEIAEEWYAKVIRESKRGYPRRWARSGMKMLNEARQRSSR